MDERYLVDCATASCGRHDDRTMGFLFQSPCNIAAFLTLNRSTRKVPAQPDLRSFSACP